MNRSSDVHRKPDAGSQVKPRFGDEITNCMASLQNPQRVGLFVREYRVTGRMNRGVWWEITDGNGKFWSSNPENCYVTPVRSLSQPPQEDTNG